MLLWIVEVLGFVGYWLHCKLHPGRLKLLLVLNFFFLFYAEGGGVAGLGVAGRGWVEFTLHCHRGVLTVLICRLSLTFVHVSRFNFWCSFQVILHTTGCLSDLLNLIWIVWNENILRFDFINRWWNRRTHINSNFLSEYSFFLLWLLALLVFHFVPPFHILVNLLLDPLVAPPLLPKRNSNSNCNIEKANKRQNKAKYDFNDEGLLNYDEAKHDDVSAFTARIVQKVQVFCEGFRPQTILHYDQHHDQHREYEYRHADELGRRFYFDYFPLVILRGSRFEIREAKAQLNKAHRNRIKIQNLARHWVQKFVLECVCLFQRLLGSNVLGWLQFLSDISFGPLICHI